MFAIWIRAVLRYILLQIDRILVLHPHTKRSLHAAVAGIGARQAAAMRQYNGFSIGTYKDGGHHIPLFPVRLGQICTRTIAARPIPCRPRALLAAEITETIRFPRFIPISFAMGPN